MMESRPEWFHEHDIQDVQRHEQILGALNLIRADIETIKNRQVSSPPSSSKTAATKGQAALVGAVVALAAVISELTRMILHAH
jgi:hypothetical protein